MFRRTFKTIYVRNPFRRLQEKFRKLEENAADHLGIDKDTHNAMREDMDLTVSKKFMGLLIFTSVILLGISRFPITKN